MEGDESGRQLDDLDTAASSGYGGCCDNGVDLASLLALLAGMFIQISVSALSSLAKVATQGSHASAANKLNSEYKGLSTAQWNAIVPASQRF